MKLLNMKWLSLFLIASLIISLIPTNFASAAMNQSTTTSKYIIKFKDVEKGKKDLVSKKKKINHSFKNVPLITSDLTSEDANDLKKDKNVEYIEPDQPIEKTADITNPNLTQIHIEEAQQLGLTGSGVKVAIMDSGINTQNPDLHVIGGASFVPDETSFKDTNGHGTLVAGILAAAKDNQGLLGVAPDVELYSLKVLDQNGQGSYSQVIQAIDWAIDNQLDVVSMSFAGKAFSSALQDAMKQAHDSGILLIAATGNDGSNSVSYPAKFSTVIAVGAVDEQNQLASFSNTGDEVELVAPGVNIPGLTMTDAITSASGTSLAVPHVAGVAALIKQNHPDYSNEDIRQVLDNSATVLGSTDQYGHGLVNAANAIQATPIAGKKTGKAGLKKESPKKIEELMSLYNVTEAFIHEQLDAGNSFKDVSDAFKYQKENGGNFTDALAQVKPIIINNSKNVNINNTSDYGDGAIDTTPDQAFVTVATVSTEALNNIKISPNQAPYSISLENENVSTLSGGLSFSATDFTLPGRGGMSFSLTRTYDSGSSQLYEPDPSNTTLMPYDEKMFPIGKGWSWNISSVETKNSKNYLHLGSQGTYEINGTSLKGYPWHDLSFTADTSVTVNGSQSTNVLKSISGLKQYFNASGQLIQMSDFYSVNAVKFSYANSATYGRSLLSSITDALNNTISITYPNTTSVLLTYGSKSVTYTKTSQNSKELLSTVLDPKNRTTTYIYNIAAASYNLFGTTPNTSDPYALITNVNYPTGAKSIYTYEPAPKTRYLDTASVNQAYRIMTRKDQVTYTTGTVDSNLKSFTYTGDMGTPYGTDYTFSTTIDDNLTKNTFNYKKDYIDTVTPSVFYNYSNVSLAGSITRTTTMTYDESNRYPSPLTTSTVTTDTNKNPQSSSPITTSNTYDAYGNVVISTNAMNVTVTNTYDPTTHWLTSTLKPVNNLLTQKQYISYAYDIVGSNIVTQMMIQDGSSSGTILQKVKYENFDAYGNPQTTKITDTGRDVLVQVQYNSTYQYAFPTQQSITVKDADYETAIPAEQAQHITTITRNYEYDTSTGLMTKSIDGKSFATSYQYDVLGRILTTTFPDTKTVSVLYEDSLNKYTVTNEIGIQTVATYNPLGYSDETYILSGTNKYNYSKNTYDIYGRVSTVGDTIGTTTFGYDAWSRQTTASSADGSIVQTLYDDIAHTKTSIDAEGVTYRETLDNLGRLVKKEEVYPSPTPAKLLGTYTYDNVDKLLTSTDGKGYVTTYGYNTLQQLTSVLNPKLETTSYAYSLTGKMTQISYPDGSTTKKKYDELGRLIQSTDQKNKIQKYYYDANNNQTKLIDHSENSFTYEYDNRNLQIKKISSDETIAFSYDYAGKRISMSDLTGVTSYNYDSTTGALESVTSPDSRTVSYQYNVQGRRSQMTDPFGQTLYYGYNNMNQLIGVSTVSNPTPTDFEASYQYYKNGLVKNVQQKNNITTAYTYDDGRLTNLIHKKADGTIFNSSTYTYDNNSNIETKTENGNPTNNFTYDELNRIKTNDQLTETYTYDNRGNRQTYQNNINFDAPDASYGYDKRDRLTSVATTDGKNVSYKYNGDGLLYERIENGTTVRFYYDGQNVIAEGTVVTNTQILDNTSPSIQYTGSGWLAQSDPNDYNGTIAYSGIANDSAQMTFTGTFVQVVARKGPAGGKADIVIDGVIVATDIDTYPTSTLRQYQSVIYSNNNLTAGTHTIKVVVKGTKNTAAVATNVMLDSISYGAVILKARYIRGGSSLIARQDAGGSKAYYLANGHSDIVELRDSTGNTSLNQYTYDIWGNPNTTNESVENPFRYSGEYWDKSTSLQYLRARWYDPSVGRFINEDTYEGDISNPLSLNLYTYVGNNPLTRSDPTGHTWTWLLNSISKLYSKKTISDAEASAATIVANVGLVVSPTFKFSKLYIPFHEIAQINVAKKLDSLNTGTSVILEKSLETGEYYTFFGHKLKEKKYEADVVMGDEVWEVKPLNGADPKKQLEKYKEVGGLTASSRLVGQVIDNITVFDELKMKLTFPNAGEVRYSFYLDDGNGTTEALTTVAAAKYLIKYLPKIITKGKGFVPIK